MKTRGNYADPTAWEAIARADRSVKIKAKHTEDARERTSEVWRSPEAEAALNAGGEPFTIWRRENINPLLRMIHDQRRRFLQLEAMEETAEGDTPA